MRADIDQSDRGGSYLKGTAMLTTATALNSMPHVRRRPARTVLGRLATVARFAGHFAVACVSVAIVGAATEH